MDIFVAVTVIQVPTTSPVATLKLIAATPPEPVVTTVEPRKVCPWPTPEGSATWLLKNWIRKLVLATLVSDPSTLLPVPPPLVPVKVGAVCESLPPVSAIPCWPFKTCCWRGSSRPFPTGRGHPPRR